MGMSQDESILSKSKSRSGDLDPRNHPALLLQLVTKDFWESDQFPMQNGAPIQTHLNEIPSFHGLKTLW